MMVSTVASLFWVGARSADERMKKGGANGVEDSDI